MFPSGQQISFHAQLAAQDPSMMMNLDSRESSSSAVPKDDTSNGGASSHAEFVLFTSKKLETDLQNMGNKIKHHDDNLNFLNSQKIRLDESIAECEARLAKLSRGENHDNNLHGDNINEQILRHANSAAGVLCLVESRHAEISKSTLMNGVVGVVAKLGKVYDENLSQVLSDYLGTRSMLAIVCKDYDSVKALENYDNHGNIDRTAGLHGFASLVGKTVEGNFDVICLENLRPYVGEHIADDPQRKLDLLKPKLPNGEVPHGFLEFAVNLIHIDPAYLLCLTSYGYGLRETLFYSLFSRLQVYRTRVDMINALACISDGAISLDGGIIRKGGVFTLGSRDEVNVRFARPTASRTMNNYSETERQLKELKWKVQKTHEDINRERVLHEHVMFSFSKKKEEFVRFLAQSPIQQP